MATLDNWPWRRWAQCRPQAAALVTQGGTLNWQQLAGRVERLALGFQQQGVYPGCGVALKAKNSESALLAYLALLQCGARLLPLNPQLPDPLLREVLPALNLDFALCLNTSALPLAVPGLQLAEGVGRITGCWNSEAIATLTLTSGSGGLPKAAAHTFSAHLASARGVVGLMNFTAQDSWLLSLPLFHVSGQGIVWRWLLAGATLVLQDGKTLAQALEACSFASLVPTQLWRILEQKAIPATLKAVLLGGATIAPALTERAEKAGICCWCGYGMTEAASTISGKRADGRSGVGLPLEGREIRLVADEIWLRAASLASGYWKNGELLPLADSDGWLHTRDRGAWREGELQIIGRLDNQFFSAGEGIQPEQIERVLLQHPAVSQAFIVPQDDEEFGQRPVAIVELVETVPLTALAAWAQDKLAGYQRPVRWYPLPDAISQGGIKISRKALHQWLNEHACQGGSSPP